MTTEHQYEQLGTTGNQLKPTYKKRATNSSNQKQPEHIETLRNKLQQTRTT